jgi:3-phenylpropionate/trans-cinnamate dioxygenase ferredoxin reductase subunit
VADAVELNRRMQPGAAVCIIGGGFIGLELAATAIGRGCSVTVLEMAPRMLGRAVPADISAVITARHELAGVALHTSVSLERIEERDGRHEVVTAGHGTVSCDLGLAGVGAIPNTELAAAAGLAIDNGIKVDEHLRTSDPDIFAAGDCASFPHPLFDRRIRLESWRNAIDQSKLAAQNMLGSDTPHTTVPWFWSDHFDLGLQITGLPGAGDVEVTRLRPDGARLLFQLSTDGRLLSAAGVGTGTAVAKDIRVAEMMINAGTHPDPAQLADPSVPLKKLLRA